MSVSSPMLLGGVPALPLRGEASSTSKRPGVWSSRQTSSSSRLNSSPFPSSFPSSSSKRSRRGGRGRARVHVNALFGGKGGDGASKETSTSSSGTKTKGKGSLASGDKKQKKKSAPSSSTPSSSSAGESATNATGKKKTSSSSTSPKKRSTKGETILTDPSFGGVRWFQRQKKKAYEYWRARSDRWHLQVGSWGQNARMPRYLPQSSYIPGDASSNPYLRNQKKLSIEDLQFTQMGRAKLQKHRQSIAY